MNDSFQNRINSVGGKDQRSELRLDNVLIRREGPKGSASVAKDAMLFARRFTMEGDELKAVGKELKESESFFLKRTLGSLI